MPKVRGAGIGTIDATVVTKSAMFWCAILILLSPLVIVIGSHLNLENSPWKKQMPKFSQESFSKLSTCHHDLQVLFYEVIKTFDCTILEGFRNEIDQNISFKSGTSKLSWPNSKHNSHPAMAVDVTPYPIDFNNSKRMYWFAGYVMGIAQKLKEEGKITHSIRYGGDWNRNKNIDDESFKDLSHFELID
jgi:peptidoglycan L-alanyl-D-glutamate endopeptidase CwlK